MNPRALMILILAIFLFRVTYAATCKLAKEGLSLYLEHSPQKIISGESFNISVGMVNNENRSTPAELYSYVYRGSKAYSPERKWNLQSLELEPYQSLSLDLINLAEAKPGEYRLMVRLEVANKTKEISVPINITTQNQFPKNLEISYLRLDQKPLPQITTLINNTRAEGYDIRLLLESNTGFSEREIFIGPNEETKLEFPLKSPEYNNYFFLKLYQNNTLIDISELILKNNTMQTKAEKPFSLIEGDIMLNESKPVYSSSSQKTRDIVIYLFLVASVILNLYFIIFKDSKI